MFSMSLEIPRGLLGIWGTTTTTTTTDTTTTTAKAQVSKWCYHDFLGLLNRNEDSALQCKVVLLSTK